LDARKISSNPPNTIGLQKRAGVRPWAIPGFGRKNTMPRSEIGRLLQAVHVGCVLLLAVYRDSRAGLFLNCSAPDNDQALRHVFRVMDAARRLVLLANTARNCLCGIKHGAVITVILPKIKTMATEYGRIH
jgi:hypothetical protein